MRGLIAVIVVVVVLVVILAFGFILLVGMFMAQDKPPARVHSVSFQDEADRYEVFLILHDEDGDEVRADGTARVEIRDSYDAVLYNGSFTVKKSDFDLYQNILGVKVLACKLEIPYSEINKSYSSEWRLKGSATFVYKDTEMRVDDDSIPYPDSLEVPIHDIFNITVEDHGRVASGVFEDNVYVNVTVKNICPYQQELSSVAWDLETIDGLIFGRWGDDPNPPDELASEASFTWMIYFDVPLGKTPAKIVYDDELEINL